MYSRFFVFIYIQYNKLIIFNTEEQINKYNCFIIYSAFLQLIPEFKNFV